MSFGPMDSFKKIIFEAIKSKLGELTKSIVMFRRLQMFLNETGVVGRQFS